MKKISPKELFNSIRKFLETGIYAHKKIEPNLEIMHKIIGQGFKDLQDNDPFVVADAVYYFFRTDHTDYTYHFHNICTVMSKDPKRVRLMLKEACRVLSNNKPMPLKLINILEKEAQNE